MAQTKRWHWLLIGAGAAALTGCGCDAVGYPGIEMTFINATTSRPVALGGAMIRVTQNGIEKPMQPRPISDSSSTYFGCCGGGQWRVRLEHAGYQPFDTTVRVRTEGRCDRPILQRVRARIFPTTTT
ncbi:MAG TPA: hypothetical protein VGE27_03315 [Gemmatimonas sp.]|uniref:hypothetical protein n=1 Tax=Gemmatimonas sp. TaxID=1962908 RepID=UPI002ED9AEDC